MKNETANRTFGASCFSHYNASIDGYSRYTIERLNLKPLKNQSPLQPKMGCPFHDIVSFRYSINQIPELCHRPRGVELLVLIVSKTENLKLRDAIRKTWLNDLKQHGGIYAFFVGRSFDKRIQDQIENENKSNGDIILVDLIEDDYNITSRTIALISWTNKFCPKAHFVLKCDDDVYVNVNNLQREIRKMDSRNPQMYGRNITCSNAPNHAQGTVLKLFIDSIQCC